MKSGIKEAKVHVRKHDGISTVIYNSSIRVTLDAPYAEISDMELTADQAYSLYLKLGRLRIVQERVEDAAMKRRDKNQETEADMVVIRNRPGSRIDRCKWGKR